MCLQAHVGPLLPDPGRLLPVSARDFFCARVDRVVRSDPVLPNPELSLQSLWSFLVSLSYGYVRHHHSQSVACVSFFWMYRVKLSVTTRAEAVWCDHRLGRKGNISDDEQRSSWLCGQRRVSSMWLKTQGYF